MRVAVDPGLPVIPAKAGIHDPTALAVEERVPAFARTTMGRIYRRSTISFLISAIALAGLRFFGQVLVQFMIVWQR